MSEYKEILKDVVSLGYAGCTMVEYAKKIRDCIVAETVKENPDKDIILTLQIAACIGWELIEAPQAFKI